MKFESVETRSEKSSEFGELNSRTRGNVTYVFAGLLVVYVLARGLRGAAARPLWLDEFLTLSIASRPSLAGMWRTIARGFDSQTPLYYLIERSALLLPFCKEITLRLPSILAFACSVVCVFVFARKRFGDVIACVCAILLLSTRLFQFYLIEARGYSLMVAFIAVAAVCYQRLPSWRWVTLLAASLFLAEAVHYYSVFAMVPFGVAEAVLLVRTRKIRWPVWLAMAAGILPLIACWRLLAAIKAYYGAHLTVAHFGNIPEFYGSYFLLPDVFGVALAVVAVAAIASWHFWSRGSDPRVAGNELHMAEGTLLLGLIALPYITFVLTRLMHGGFIERYMLPATLGIVLGLGYMLSIVGSRAIIFFAIFLLSSVGLREARFWRHSGLDPRTEDFATRSPKDLAAIRDLIQSAGHSDLPIMFSEAVLFPQIVYYSSPEWTHRVIYLTDERREFQHEGSEGMVKIMEGLGSVFPMPLADYTKFTTEHSEFLVYSEPTEWALNALRDEGNDVQVLKADGNKWLYLVKMKIDTPK